MFANVNSWRQEQCFSKCDKIAKQIILKTNQYFKNFWLKLNCSDWLSHQHKYSIDRSRFFSVWIIWSRCIESSKWSLFHTCNISKSIFVSFGHIHPWDISGVLVLISNLCFSEIAFWDKQEIIFIKLFSNWSWRICELNWSFLNVKFASLWSIQLNSDSVIKLLLIFNHVTVIWPYMYSCSVWYYIDFILVILLVNCCINWTIELTLF